MLQSSEKHFDNLLFLPAALRSYIPKQLLKNVNIEECFDENELKYVQNVVDNSNDSLRMYGSAESLLQNLKVYMDFPLSYKIFPLGMRGDFHVVPNIYKTLKKEDLYCKQDFLFYLQSGVYVELQRYENAQKWKFAELIEYMKNHERRLSGCYEFVKYSYDVFEDIRISLSCYKSMHVVSENAEMTPTVGVLQAVDCEEIQEKGVVEVFDNLISKYPCLFLPNSETRDKNATAVVRIFDDGNLKFVMESELFTAINLKNPDQKPLECMDIEGHYRTIEYKHVLERYRDQIGDIDFTEPALLQFIYQLIPFGLHVAVPIVAPTGDHCIQAVDAYMDIITETFITGIFQKLTQNTSHMIPKFFAILRKYFPPNIKYRFFINLKLFQKLREELEEFWKPIEDKPWKSVRNVGPQGFTVEDLMKELKYLGYTKIFPEITAAALAVYSVFLSQKPSELNTSDMYRSIQGALLLVVTRRYPCLNEFMFRQKVCLHNRRNPCDFCLKTIKEAEARIEAEIKAESEQASSSVTAPISEDDIKEEEESEESNAESVTSEAFPIVKRDPEHLKKSLDSSLAEAETKPISAISESEVSDHNPVSSDSNSQKMPRESCLKVIKKAQLEQDSSTVTVTTSEDKIEKEEVSEESNPELVTSEGLSIAMSNFVEAKINSLTAISELEGSEQSPILTDSNSHTCEKCMKTSNEARIEVIETFRKMMGQSKEQSEQLKLAQKELEKAVKEELLEAVRTVNMEKDSIETLKSQLVEKDNEIAELKNARTNAEASQLEEVEKLKKACFELEKKVNVRLEQIKIKDSENQKLELKSSKLIEEKNQEIEKLKKQQAMAAKEHKQEMEQLNRNASESADELKKLTARIAEKEAAENLLKRSNKGLLEKLQKTESRVKEVTNRRAHLETEVAEKNRKFCLFLLELQKSAENQVSEQERTKKELETRISKIRGMLDEISPPEPESEDTDCLICLEEIKPEQKTLKCDHCGKIMHLKCTSNWHKVKRICAHCQQNQLDPNEFPSLQ